MNGECDSEDPSTAAASQQPHVNVSSLFGDTFDLAKVGVICIYALEIITLDKYDILE